ncbi:hypothetical protein BU15DRAFT_72590 [Melanogaster broomeanus]|nr:hypothetical protein BU15DRAFT_72590 [Melanogaster broomeanus]
MQWVASRAARGALILTRTHRPLSLSAHSVTALAPHSHANPNSSPYPHIRSIFSSYFLTGQEPFYEEVVELPRPVQPPEPLEASQSPKSLHAPEYNFFHPPPPPPVQSPLPSTHLALIAATTVRQFCNAGAFSDAHYIINSMVYSKHPNAPRPEPLRLPFLPSFEFVPITFDKPISPRLAAHALLHHMIRKESPLQAYETAQKLMKMRIRLREATILKVIEALLQAPPTVFTALKHQSMSILPRASGVSNHLPINPEAAKDDGLRFALMLLLKVRENNQRCSDRTFETLVGFCLIQGEIIMGSLLFVLLVKDYEVRSQMAQEVKAKITEQETCQGVASPKLRHLWKDLIRRKIPSNRLLKAITHHCGEQLAFDSDSEEDETRRAEALQALANLAGLIHARTLPHSDISYLLRGLYACPKLPNKVTVIEYGEERQVNAYRYFHHVIFRLVHHLPNGKDPPDKHPGKQGSVSSVMPPLSRETYNTLVHYSLRHRLSVSLAQKALHHMEHVRRPALRPDITTYNIVVRSGTLLRRNDMVTFALEELRKLKENKGHGIILKPDRPAPLPNRFPDTTRLSDVLAVSPTSSQISADEFTLTSYITHLTSTGNPHVVASILTHVLPEISIVDHPAWGDNPPSVYERAMMARRTRQERLNRAVSLGPWFFTSVLNALCKAGKTGLAERVWLLAKQAERASWVMHGNQGPEVGQGWCLPVHAYTIMMQLYGMELRKVFACALAYGGQVKGWAFYVLVKDAVARRHRSRRTLGLRMGTVLYRSMFRAARDIYDSLTKLIPSSQPQIYQLQPDARFFNAALDMFGRQAGKRAAYTGPAHWRQKEGKARMRFSRWRKVPQKHNPFLKRIVQDLITAGYELPIAFRRMFIGSWAYGSLDRPGRPTLNRQPFAFPVPKRKKFLPHALRTHKDRGLPVQRSEWKQVGHRWKNLWRRRLRRKRMIQRT